MWICNIIFDFRQQQQHNSFRRYKPIAVAVAQAFINVVATIYRNANVWVKSKKATH